MVGVITALNSKKLEIVISTATIVPLLSAIFAVNLNEFSERSNIEMISKNNFAVP